MKELCITFALTIVTGFLITSNLFGKISDRIEQERKPTYMDRELPEPVKIQCQDKIYWVILPEGTDESLLIEQFCGSIQ